MNPADNDTIFALSSGAPPAAIAVMRISGADAFAAVEALAGTLPHPRAARLRRLRDPVQGDEIDQALVLVFPGPDTATGEDLAELHLHGGRAVVARIAEVLAGQSGLRSAEPGEFTRRALINGRIDLTEAEGLADLLEAETETQRRAALSNAEGGLRRHVERWAARTVSLAASVEAAIDHEDEGDVDPDALIGPVRNAARDLATEIAQTLAQPRTERIRDGIRVVLAGPPNSGKSTLFNALIDRDAAIVSSIAGTTRDRIEAHVKREGIAWLFVDTAGIAEHTDDPIERIGIERTADAISVADVVLWLGDEAPPKREVIALYPRADDYKRTAAPAGRIKVSAATGEGLDDVWNALRIRADTILPGENSVLLNQRQAACAMQAASALNKLAVLEDPILMAEELRIALSAFDRLTGRANVEAVLDDVFSRFCVGK